MSKQKLLPYQNEGVLELGIDEAGRGCLIGRLYVAGVILPNNIIELCDEEDIVIKDSKKMTKTNKERAREFIERNAIDYSIVYKENTYIDEHNILVATMDGMHEVVDNISIKPDKLLIDGNYFKKYVKNECVKNECVKNECVKNECIPQECISQKCIPHECVIEGDNTYMSIAAASILAKTYKDKYIEDIVKEYPDLEKYGLPNNSGYGTEVHINAIKEFGLSQFHRKTFGICKNY